MEDGGHPLWERGLGAIYWARVSRSQEFPARPAARGDLQPGSDIDLLVVMPDGAHRRRTAQHLYGRLGSDRPPVDLVVASESDILDHGDASGYVYRTALREGRELYAA
ncbi:MAG: nucleotidyltransferase domain-containing protein [Actinobacteria bacterium]|nr:nucleotidyltransferase domain-containing protein [Actinomycetota bacterium]